MTRSRLRTLAPWMALVLVLLGALGYAAVSAEDDPTPRARVEKLSREIRCPTCVSQSVAESNSEAAETIRADIVDRVDAGQSDDEIKQAYVERYSEWVLLDPERSGIALVVWLLPLILVLGAVGVLVVYLASRRRSSATAVDAQDEAVVALARSERSQT